jgi:hypothetical protein
VLTIAVLKEAGMLSRGSIWVLTALGAVLIAVSAYRVVEPASDSGQLPAAAAGCLLLLSPFIINRVEQLKVGASGLQLRLSKDVAEQGAPKTARILDRTDLAMFAQSYSLIHDELDSPQYRTAKLHLQDLLVERAAATARREKFDADEVRTLFKNAAPTMRVLVLGLMRGDPSLADGPTIVDAIEKPLSANEQFQGLNLALSLWSRLEPPYRAAVRTAINDSPDIMAGTSRRSVAEKILALPLS